MSALRRPGYGPYLGAAGEPAPPHSRPPPPGPWRMPGDGGPVAAAAAAYYPPAGPWPDPAPPGGLQDHSPYTNYGSNYWNSATQQRASYPSTYPVRPDLQGQGMDSYTDEAYGPHYPPGSGTTTPPYSGTYYSSVHPQTPYPTEAQSTYRSPGTSPSPVSRWTYPQQDCQSEGPSLRGQVPGYSASQSPGMALPHYPYGDGNSSIPQPGPPPQPQEEAWASSGVYGMTPRYSWSSASSAAPSGNLFVSGSTSSWPSSGSPQPTPSPPSPPLPPSLDSKDPSYPYSQPEQGMNQHSFPCDAHQYESSGTMNNNNKPDPFSSKVQYSAQPQLYGNSVKKERSSQDVGFKSPDEAPSSDSPDHPPGIKKIIQVLEKVQYLEREVEEFVGKKTDKAYWLLEEMLTKELLELDSVETGGQDAIRQPRKEAVYKIQAILEKLERKGL
ncbi:BAG family molecular chaperone regulator 4 isoform X1 [Ornithorhynchus anatinus]|uniref:BAG family molecular chaperone regulator 4 isoform X1 n=1 Tax=Ornithorhynchus anatinus TaxID=9258 RepID=UPI0010A8B052|nr:BAG family molecular chaperone regulator 4 isoform X1 [Ornithorhynchus anatinus]